MWYHIKDMDKKMKYRASLQACSRCGFYYPKKQSVCHHCANMDDEQLLRNLARKKHFRLSLGKAMLLGALLILVFMVLI